MSKTTGKPNRKCTVCNIRVSNTGAKCNRCYDGIDEARRSPSGETKHFKYVKGKWVYKK